MKTVNKLWRKKRTQPPLPGTDEGRPSQVAADQTNQRPCSPPPTTSTTHPTGCETLFEGTAPIIAEQVPFQFRINSLTDRTSSIVFVHGLRGHPTMTWTKDNVCWPRDLLSKEAGLCHTRVLTFGYDANIVSVGGHASLNSLFKHSVNLLNDLSQERRRDSVSAVRFPCTILDSDPFSGIGLLFLLPILLED